MQHIITADNIQSFCRSCLNELQQKQTYNIQAMDVQVRQWLEDSTAHKAPTNDSLPLFVCQQCRDKLECFLEFNRMCSRSRRILLDILEKSWNNQKELKSSSTTCWRSEIAPDVDCMDGQRNEHQVNCDWLEFDFVAIPKSLTELQSKTYKKEATEKEELLTSTLCPSSAEKEESLGPYDRNFDDEFSHSHDEEGVIKTDPKDGDKEGNSIIDSSNKTKKTKIKRYSTPERKQQLNNEGKPQHICEECGKVYPSLARLTEHQYSHKPKEEYPFHCSQCSKAFKHRQTFNAHQLRHAGIKNHQCPYCEMKKTTKSELRAHINHHTKERQWLCPKCPMTFSSAANLRRHDQVVHQGIRRYSCSYCEQTFGKQESLKHHEMRHTGEKPHKCSECGKGFIQLVALKTHMKTHNKYSN